MPDPYASIAERDEALQARLADVLELRATDPRQAEMLEAHLSLSAVAPDAAVLEVGCGTGAISRRIAEQAAEGAVVGVDPSPVFIERARSLAGGRPNLSFEAGDARSLDFEDASFDLVVFYTTLCHVPSPARALKEACRVLRPGGTLSIFDGDYVTATVAIAEHDPLQVVVERMTEHFVENIWVTRRLPRLLAACGARLTTYRSHGYTKVSEPSYFLTIIERGVSLLVDAAVIGPDHGASLLQEARRRDQAGEFFGHISYVSAVATKQ